MYFFSKLWACLTCWEVPVASPTELMTAQVIVTQAVEYDRDRSPGPGNVLLARAAAACAEQTGSIVIPQYELLKAGSMPLLTTVGDRPMRTIFGERPVHTARVCQEQAIICRRRGWTHVAVITFPDHWWRTYMCYRKCGLVPLMVPMPSHKQAEYYSRNAVRWHMRRRFTFRLFDRLARLAYWASGNL